MTKKKSTTKTKPQKYPISYGFHQYDDENMDGWGITERVNQLIRQATSYFCVLRASCTRRALNRWTDVDARSASPSASRGNSLT